MAPLYSYFQDLSIFFFGSSEDKDRAFYGTLPYPMNIIQPMSPPITRTIYPVFGALLSGDWDRVFSYRVWKYFPFGRMANSVRKTMEDPRMSVEQLLGVPIHRMAQDAQKVWGPREVTEGLLSGLL